MIDGLAQRHPRSECACNQIDNSSQRRKRGHLNGNKISLAEIHVAALNRLIPSLILLIFSEQLIKYRRRVVIVLLGNMGSHSDQTISRRCCQTAVKFQFNAHGDLGSRRENDRHVTLFEELANIVGTYFDIGCSHLTRSVFQFFHASAVCQVDHCCSFRTNVTDCISKQRHKAFSLWTRAVQSLRKCGTGYTHSKILTFKLLNESARSISNRVHLIRHCDVSIVCAAKAPIFFLLSFEGFSPRSSYPGRDDCDCGQKCQCQRAVSRESAHVRPANPDGSYRGQYAYKDASRGSCAEIASHAHSSLSWVRKPIIGGLPPKWTCDQLQRMQIRQSAD